MIIIINSKHNSITTTIHQHKVPDAGPWQQAVPVTEVPATSSLHTACPSQMPVSPKTQLGMQHHPQYSSNNGTHTALNQYQPVTRNITRPKYNNISAMFLAKKP